MLILNTLKLISRLLPIRQNNAQYAKVVSISPRSIIKGLGHEAVRPTVFIETGESI